MDTSETYIKMCQQATEIQAAWVPQPGDYCIGNEYEGFIQFGTPAIGDCPAGITWDNENNHSEPRADVICLFRQDQLQEMYGQFGLQSMCAALYNFSTSAVGSTITIAGSMEQLWLAFVMWEKYNKTWNGEDWVGV